MIHDDPRFIEAVTRTVGTIEKSTTAEVVVVAATRSAPWLGRSIGAGAAAAWLAYLLANLLPLHFEPLLLALELPLLGLAVGAAVHRFPRLLAPLISSSAATDAVAQAASAAFHDEVVHGTRARTGVLIYVSAVEQRVAVRADGGVEAAVPPGVWATLPWCGSPSAPGPEHLDAFLTGLDTLGRALAEHLPANEDDNPDELPDAPRIRR